MTFPVTWRLDDPLPKPEPITEAELNAIRERCKRATAGRWIAIREHPIFGTIGGPVCYMDEDESVVVGTPGDWGPTNDPMHDAEFIAHAREDVPRLLDEVMRLRALLSNCDKDSNDTQSNDVAPARLALGSGSFRPE